MTRTYVMQARSRSAAATRARILGAAHSLLDKPDGGGLTLQEVADAAGVSRATIYNSIGSRRDLLSAVFEDQGRLIRYDRVLSAMAHQDPARAVVATVRESCRAWAIIPGAIRKTLALAVIDPEIGQLVQEYEGYRRKELVKLARRLKRSQSLNPQLGIHEIAVNLTLLSSFPAFDQLRLDHDVSGATRHLVRIARTSLGLDRYKEK